MSFARRGAPGQDHRSPHPGDRRHLHAAHRPRSARHQAVPELLRGRLLLPRGSRQGLGPHQDRSHLRPRRDQQRPEPRQAARLRPDRRARRLDRADHLGASRLLRADLVRVQEERQGRHDQPKDRGDSRDAAGRGDRELLRGRPQRRLHRLRQADVPIPCHQLRGAASRLEGRLSELRDRQAEPGRRGVGDDADDHERRLRRDHRQRRPDERGRLSDRREAASGPEAARSARSRCSERAPAPPRTR